MSDFNEDELTAPIWMNEEFFIKVLKKSEEDHDISIKELEITPASVKGDHFASVMFRVKINYITSKSTPLSKSMIVKIAPEVDGEKKDLLAESFVFETEIDMYSHTIPKFEEELRKIGDQTVLGAKALFYSLEPRKCIIFEDIVPQGYEVLRDRPLNLEEAKATYTKLAKWHAVSYKLAAEGDKAVTSYEHGIFNANEVQTVPFMTSGIDLLLEKLETLNDLRKYVPQIRAIKDDILLKCIKSSNSYKNEQSEGIFVLCHGDFHCKNVMFKRNDQQELEDVKLIDFQLCFFGPAVMDVLYGMYMLIATDLRTHHYEEIIHHYCSCFIETLEKLKFSGKIPKIFEFYVDILHHKHLELYMLSTFMPMWFAPEVDSTKLDIGDLIFSNDSRKKLYDTPSYIKELRHLLPKMAHKGYFE